MAISRSQGWWHCLYPQRRGVSPKRIWNLPRNACKAVQTVPQTDSPLSNKTVLTGLNFTTFARERSETIAVVQLVLCTCLTDDLTSWQKCHNLFYFETLLVFFVQDHFFFFFLHFSVFKSVPFFSGCRHMYQSLMIAVSADPAVVTSCTCFVINVPFSQQRGVLLWR